MRRLLGSIALIAVLGAATFASAADGTGIIYDLADLEQMPRAFDPERLPDLATPNLPIAGSPSQQQISHGELGYSASDDGFEIHDPRGLNRGPNRDGVETHTGSFHTRPNDNANQATPNPEPGTLLLMGSGLAAGARYIRRRRQTS